MQERLRKLIMSLFIKWWELKCRLQLMELINVMKWNDAAIYRATVVCACRRRCCCCCCCSCKSFVIITINLIVRLIHSDTQSKSRIARAAAAAAANDDDHKSLRHTVFPSIAVLTPLLILTSYSVSMS